MRICELEGCNEPLKNKQKRFHSQDCYRQFQHQELLRMLGPPRYCPGCGVQLSRWQKETCSLECRENTKKVGKKYICKKEKTIIYEVTCKCPACSELHKQKLSYMPKIMPRIFCEHHEHRRGYSFSFENERM